LHLELAKCMQVVEVCKMLEICEYVKLPNY
jgi:hypothetical protein